MAYKQLNRLEIVNEIEKYGFMCDFEKVKDALKKLEDEHVLVLADPEQKCVDADLNQPAIRLQVRRQLAHLSDVRGSLKRTCGDRGDRNISTCTGACRG